MAKSAKSLLQSARASMARARAKEREMQYMAIEKGSGLATSVGLAMLSDKMPTSVMNLPTKLMIAGGAYIGAVMTKGNLSRSLEAIGDSSSHVYAYLAAMKVKQGESQPWVAGVEDAEDEAGFVDEV